MSAPQPEYQWVFPPEKPSRGRVWLIVLLAAAAILIAGGVFALFLRPWESAEPVPTASTTPSASETPTASASPSATPSPTPSLTPTETPSPEPSPRETQSQPPVADPDLSVFRGKVQDVLDTADTGLSYAADSSGAEGVQLMDELGADAERLSDAVAPQSIADRWGAAVSAYGSALRTLRTAYEQGSPIAEPLAAAERALRELHAIVR